MSTIIETDQSLELRYPMRPLTRVLLLLLSLFPLLAPYQLIYLPDWQSYWNVYFLFVALISLGAMAVSAFLIWAAIAGLSKELLFDKNSHTFSYIQQAPVVRPQRTDYPLASIKSVELEKTEWTDGGPSYHVSIEMLDGRKFSSGSSWTRTETEQERDRVMVFLERTLKE
jgi:hypothetical protein